MDVRKRIPFVIGKRSNFHPCETIEDVERDLVTFSGLDELCSIDTHRTFVYLASIHLNLSTGVNSLSLSKASIVVANDNDIALVAVDNATGLDEWNRLTLVVFEACNIDMTVVRADYTHVIAENTTIRSPINERTLECAFRCSIGDTVSHIDGTWFSFLLGEDTANITCMGLLVSTIEKCTSDRLVDEQFKQTIFGVCSTGLFNTWGAIIICREQIRDIGCARLSSRR